MEHEIAGQAVKAAMDGALVGTADRKKEPMTGKKALKAMERVTVSYTHLTLPTTSRV